MAAVMHQNTLLCSRISEYILCNVVLFGESVKQHWPRHTRGVLFRHKYSVWCVTSCRFGDQVTRRHVSEHFIFTGNGMSVLYCCSYYTTILLFSLWASYTIYGHRFGSTSHLPNRDIAFGCCPGVPPHYKVPPLSRILEIMVINSSQFCGTGFSVIMLTGPPPHHVNQINPLCSVTPDFFNLLNHIRYFTHRQV